MRQEAKAADGALGYVIWQNLTCIMTSLAAAF